MFGEKLARWPESSLPSKVAQSRSLPAVDSARETASVVSEVTSKRNGVEGLFNNDMTDDGMFEKTRNNSQYLSHTCGHVWSAQWEKCAHACVRWGVLCTLCFCASHATLILVLLTVGWRPHCKRHSNTHERQPSRSSWFDHHWACRLCARGLEGLWPSSLEIRFWGLTCRSSNCLLSWPQLRLLHDLLTFLFGPVHVRFDTDLSAVRKVNGLYLACVS